MQYNGTLICVNGNYLSQNYCPYCYSLSDTAAASMTVGNFVLTGGIYAVVGSGNGNNTVYSFAGTYSPPASSVV